MIDFMDRTVRLNPYPEYRRMRSTSPIAFDERTQTWYAFRYDDVKAIISNPADFSNRTAALMGGGAAPLIHFDPPRHSKQRALINKAFTPKMIAGLERRAEQIAQRFLDRIVEAGETDFVKDFASPLPVAVISEMMGIPDQDHTRIKRWADNLAVVLRSPVWRVASASTRFSTA